MTLRHRPHLVLLAATTAFIAAYYALVALGSPLWLIDASLLVPCAAAAALHSRRALRTPGRAASFWRLTTGGLALWLAGQLSWSAAEFFGYDPAGASGEIRRVPAAGERVVRRLPGPLPGRSRPAAAPAARPARTRSPSRTRP